MEFKFILWHYCLFFVRAPIEKLLPGIIMETLLCRMAIYLLILSSEQYSLENIWRQVSRRRETCSTVNCVAGKAKHSCKERGISQPVFFSLTSSSVGNVYKLKSNVVRILLWLHLLPDIALNITQQWVRCLKKGGLFFFPWGLKRTWNGYKFSHYLRS